MILVMVGLVAGVLRSGLRRGDWGLVVLLGLLGNTLFHSLLVSAIHRTSPSHAAILVALSPVLAALLAYALLGEALGPRRIGGIALGFAGVALIVTRGTHGSPTVLGDLLSLGASLSWALYTVVGKPLLARASPLAVTAWATLVGVIPMLPLGVPGLYQVRWGELTPGQWLLVVYLSVGTIALANLLWYVVVARTAIVRVVGFSFLIPVIATTIAAFTGQETLTPSLALGAAAVLGGVALAHRA